MSDQLQNQASIPDLPAHIALIGNSLPRRCGIATFTSHCHDALAAAFPAMRIDHYAMDDGMPGIAYAPDIRRIAQDDVIAYSQAAKEIEESGAQAIWLQHEFGIFGGSAGDLVLRLLDRTGLPLVTTLHTVLDQPNRDERRVTDELIARSSRIMVMAERGREILREVYGAPADKIVVIPHGVPDRPQVNPATLQSLFGWQGRRVILTFGLLAPDKGIDVMIRAMPAVAARHPDALYVILGETHPNLVRDQGGDRLREELTELARSLGVERHVAFLDGFVEQEQLLDYLQAADIYVTPYLNPAQITSGTLSYAIGMGRPVVSTPYVNATEVLADEVGVIVPFRDEAALADALSALLDDDILRRSYADRAYALGRGMIWSELARNVGRALAGARAAQPVRLVPRRNYEPLAPDATAVIRMSDSTGMLQHGILSVPDREHGYCIDDNARALMMMSHIPDLDPVVRDQWTTVYASFVQHAWNRDARRFRNFMAFDRRWCEDVGSEDSGGRGVWALGVTARDAPLEKHRRWAAAFFDRIVDSLPETGSPRAQAFIILGAAAILDVQPAHARARALLEKFGRNLLSLVERTRRPDWAWFEVMLAYDNARLPEALIVAGDRLGDAAMVEVGLDTLEWIVADQRAPEGHFRAVGSESFGRAFEDPLPFDQQPLEAQATIDAAAAAWAVSGSAEWLAVADNAYRWFLGQNDLATPLATPLDGGCYDGLTPRGVNQNQGAESILALQLASCAMNRLSAPASLVAKDRRAEVEPISA